MLSRITPSDLPRQAILSECGKYRYRLDRSIMSPIGYKIFGYFGINPSTADAEIDDATVRKWRGFTSRNGGCRFVVGNVFAYRATDVRQLKIAEIDVIENRQFLSEIIDECDVLVPCWGNEDKAPKTLRFELIELKSRLARCGKPVLCFGRTQNGSPKHPLMLGYSTPLVPYLLGSEIR
mgnify:CR=1 FL=1